MKFSLKVFFTMTIITTISFALFGNYLLSSFFKSSLNKEISQGPSEMTWFGTIFSLTLPASDNPVQAVPKTMQKITANLNKNQNYYFAYADAFLYQDFVDFTASELLPIEDFVQDVVSDLKPDVIQWFSMENLMHGGVSHNYILYVSSCIAQGTPIYLGICRDITGIYEMREKMLGLYRLSLFIVVLLNAVVTYLISRMLTMPLVRLSRKANQITDGRSLKKGFFAPRQPSPHALQDEITELANSFERMTEQLIDQMEALRLETDRKALEARQKEDFIAAFSHELKTPLTSIIGYADMLRSVDVSRAEAMEAYFHIYSQGKRLLGLSYKLLELVSVEKGQYPFGPVSTQELEKTLKATMRIRIQAKESGLVHGKVRLEAGTLYGDKDLILSLLYNLLDNALKAIDEEGFVYLSGRALPDAYEIKVVDNGRGIPKEELGRIMEPFYMVDKSRARREGGAGIGMALCKKILDLHNARFSIESEPGQGTVAAVYFPAERSGS